MNSHNIDTKELRPRRLAVLLPVVWSVRNVVYSGVLDLLANAGVEVHVLLPQSAFENSRIDGHPAFSRASSCSQMVMADPDNTVLANFLNNVMKRSLHRYAGHSGLEIGQCWLGRSASPLGRLKSSCARGLSALIGSDFLFAGARTAYRRWMERRGFHPLVVDQLKEISPDLVWCTAWGLAGEDPYGFAADRLGLPTVVSIVGFDNPFTFGVRPKFSRYLVWNDMMQRAIQRGDPSIANDSVTVTGTPQFDFHRWKSAAWDRERTLRQLGIAATAHYFLYGASHELHTPDEPVLVQRLAEVIGSIPALRDHVIVVRLHPLDNADRWLKNAQLSDQVIFSRPLDPPCDEKSWTISSLADQELLVNSLRHADACINIASTIALDAGIMDCPVIAVDFSTERDRPPGLYFEEYETDYYKPLVESGGLDVARNWDDLKTMLQVATIDPGRRRSGRERMVQRVCGTVDGHSARRVADAVLATLAETVGAEN